MGSEVSTFLDLVGSLGVPVALLLVFLGGFRFGWWVPGDQYRWVVKLSERLLDAQQKSAEADEAHVNALLDDARRERR